MTHQIRPFEKAARVYGTGKDICSDVPTSSQLTDLLQVPSARHSILVPPTRLKPMLQLTGTNCPNVVEAFVKSTVPLATVADLPQSDKK